MKLSKLLEYIKINENQNIEDIHKSFIIDINKDLEKKEQIPLIKKIKLYYYYRKFLNDKLYELDKIIRLNYNDDKKDNEDEKSLAYYFYLTLLIRENDFAINYSYSIEYIQEIIKILKIINANQYYDIIYSKIINELVNNYKGLYEYEYNKKEIENIENDNNELLKLNNDILKELNIKNKDFKNKKIDEIYSSIILSLIKNNRFEEKIINQLDLESIDITTKIFEDIVYILNNDNNIKKRYQISNIEDLNDDKKINFYYILLKYILKNTIFNDKINLLSEIKANISKLDNSDFDKNEKLKYIKEKMFEQKQQEKTINDRIENISTTSRTKIEPSEEKPEPSNSNHDIKTINNCEESGSSQNNNGIKKAEDSSNNKYSSERTEPNATNNVDHKKDSKITSESFTFEPIDIFESDKPKESEEIEKKENKINKEKESEALSLITADFITQINDDIFICGGSCKDLCILGILDRNCQKRGTIENKHWVYNVLLFKKEGDSIDILGSSKKQLFLFNVDSNFNINQKADVIKYYSQYLVEITNSNNTNNSSYFSCADDNLIFTENIFSKIIQSRENSLVHHMYLKSGIKINDKIVAFKSNRIIRNGIDNLVFFNYISKKELKFKLKNKYSFIFSSNGLTVMDFGEKGEKVLLCACKKYLGSQKNGILSINIKDSNINNPFFKDTKNFEVYCFCPIIKNINQNILNSNEVKIERTDYFLVGGFDLKRKKGLIKLFKINYGKDNEFDNIEFIEDLFQPIDSNNKHSKNVFKKPISCIIQTNIDNKILATCWDGKIYSLTEQKIGKYLEYEEKNRDRSFCRFFQKL